MPGRDRTVAVICEYNPFHFGHLHQLGELKGKYKTVIGVMSGDTVQRGEVAIADKYVRARAAVRCGMNAVFSLPFPYCCASAEDFARAGVFIAGALGADSLAFGIEDDFPLVREAAEVTGGTGFRREAAALIKTRGNLSYPKAVSLLAGERFGALMKKPNNILAVEYLRALKLLGSTLVPEPVLRDTRHRSSSALRDCLESDGRAHFLSLLPEESAGVYASLNADIFPRSTEKLGRTLLFLLRTRAVPHGLYGFGGGLDARMAKEARVSASFGELVKRCACASFTDARVRRAALSLLFGISAAAVKENPKYTLLLASDAAGREFIKKATLSIPVITKPASVRNLPGDVRSAFEAETEAELALCLCCPGNARPVSPFEKTPFVL